MLISIESVEKKFPGQMPISGEAFAHVAIIMNGGDFDFYCNILELFAWFMKNIVAIKMSDVPKELIACDGGFLSIDAYYKKLDNYINDDSDQNAWDEFECLRDRVLEFREVHDIVFALRGINIPSLYFAKYRNKYFAVACINGVECVDKVDLDSMLETIEDILQNEGGRYFGDGVWKNKLTING